LPEMPVLQTLVFGMDEEVVVPIRNIE